jgi:flagellar M-ring protein FliF
LEPGDAARVTESLKDVGIEYRLEHDGRSVQVMQKSLYEARMEMARQGLPEAGGVGYEIFDKMQLGMTDLAQNLNFKRALEGELVRTIESLQPVEKARIHIMVPKPTLFTDTKEEARASVFLKVKPGRELEEAQVRGITHLMASSVEGLKARQVSVLDQKGNLLTRGFADNPLAEQTDHNLTLQTTVESKLERKVLEILESLVGPGKVRVKISAELDFDAVRKTVESYDPNTKVVRSQQRDEGLIKGSPEAQLDQKEGSITNYEFDKTVAHVVGAPGARKRLTVSVAVDGTYETGPDGKENYVPRPQEELDKFTALAKNAVGFKPGQGDEVFVTNVQFDIRHRQELLQTFPEEEGVPWMEWLKNYGIMLLIAVFALFFVRGLIQNLGAAMNPPKPQYAGLDLTPLEEKVPENVQKQKDLLEKVEIMTQTEPVNIANLIKTWIHEPPETDNDEDGEGGKKGKKATAA